MAVHRGFFDFDKFYDAYLEHGVDARHALIHFRITTRGDTSADNCHPFPLSEGALIHNGTLDNLGEKGKGKSDTRELSELLFNETPETLKRLQPLLEAYFDYNKVAVLHQSGEVVVFNRHKWIEKDGVLYSNSSYTDTYYSRADFNDWKQWAGHGASTTVGTLGGTGVGAGAGASLEDLDYEDDWFSDDYEWEDGMLMRATLNGLVVRDYDLENLAYDCWFERHDDAMVMPISDEDWDIMDYIASELIRKEEFFRCPSTPTVMSPPTAMTTASSPPTSPATSPTPSSSTARWPASTATSTAPPTPATASPSVA